MASPTCAISPPTADGSSTCRGCDAASSGASASTGTSPERRYANDADNDARLLVAASPTDRVADTHWLREDVDHHFVRQAEAAGVAFRDRTRVTAISFSGRGVRLRTESEGAIREVRAEMVVDATGPGGLLRRALPIPSRLGSTATRSLLLFSHFAGARLFADVAREAGAALPPGPYPEDWAAVHHVLDEGWMYVLRFDHGVVSAGLLATPEGARRLSLAPGGDASRSWDALLARYPSLAAQFQEARPVFPVRFAGRVQYRLAQAAGDRWILLPHTYAFVDPLFSTGIAWSLLAVERLAEAFGNARDRRRGLPSRAALRRYEALLAAEADQIDRLVAGSYLALPDFALFAAHAMLYFARGELHRDAPAARRGKRLGGFPGRGRTGNRTDLPGVIPETGPPHGPRTSSGVARTSVESSRNGSAGAVASRNVAGLADPDRRNLYPVDLEVLVERSHLLGLTPADVRRALPRLRAGG